MERFGIATASEVEIETLTDRLREAVVARSSVITLQMAVCARTRKP